MNSGLRRGLPVALAALLAGACGGRNTANYRAFAASHDAVRPGMSIREVFEAGLADYLQNAGGKNVAGATVPDKQPVSRDCRRHVLEVHYGPGESAGHGGFSIRVYCNMNGPADRQVAPPRQFPAKLDLLQGLDTYAPWAKSLRFRVESPALRIGGVFDSYEFTLDENGTVADVSDVRLASS